MPGYSESNVFLAFLFADNKSADTKENQEIALERLDDIHDVMVGPAAWYWGIQGLS